MKTTRKNNVKLISRAACTAITILCAGAVGAQTPNLPNGSEFLNKVFADNEDARGLNGDEARHLSGVWRMKRTPVDCQTGQPVAPSFQALLSFNEDGTLTGYAIPPFSSPALNSPEYGLWRRERGNGNYSFTDLSFSYDQGGAFAGSTELIAKVQIAANGTLTHQTKINISDANGALLFSACGVASGTRFL